MLSFGQYLHEAGRLQGRASASFQLFYLVLVDARTKCDLLCNLGAT